MNEGNNFDHPAQQSQLRPIGPSLIQAIYTHFRRIVNEPPVEGQQAVHHVEGLSTTNPTDAGSTLDGPTAVSLPVETMGLEGTATAGGSSLSNCSEKALCVLAVLEQQFPEEVLHLSPEHDDKELEHRFTDYPQLQKRITSLEATLGGQMLQHHLPLPPSEHPPPPNGIGEQPAGACLPPLIPGEMALPPLDQTPAATAGTAADVNLNPNKRKVENELKKMRSQLKKAKKQINQLSRGRETEDTMSRKAVEKKEKAMAAAVPFDQRYQELVFFQRGHGHTRVPCTSKENPGLARWVQTLRAAYKEKQKRGNRYYGQLTDERQARLEKIGFQWVVQPPKATWQQRFEQLSAYKVEHGHCRVVRSFQRNPSLGEWCHRQRFLAHKNQLEEHKVKQLTDLGFEIWVRKQGKSWEDHFAMLLDFRRKYQHLNVPAPDTRTKAKQVLSTVSATTNMPSANIEDCSNKDGESEEGRTSPSTGAEAGPPNSDSTTEEYKEQQAFRRWVLAQRDNYHLKLKKGVKSTLNNTRVKKLDSIGFDWTREGGENDLRKTRRGELHHRNDPSIWKRRFEEVVEYKKRFGDCNIPKEWSDNKQLGAWVSTQRKMYKALLAGERSSLTPERRSALESIGFTWILRPARTRPKILEIDALQQRDDFV